jgi:hypothetical protein
VEQRRVEEADADLVYALSYLFGRQLDARPASTVGG